MSTTPPPAAEGKAFDMNDPNAWQRMSALDWWEHAIRLMDDHKLPIQASFIFANHTVTVGVCIAAVDGVPTAAMRAANDVAAALNGATKPTTH